MGSGLAEQVNKKWPGVASLYKKSHKTHGLELGQIVALGGIGLPKEAARFVHEVSNQLPPAVVFVNAMTQLHYGRDKNVQYADYDAIFEAFTKILPIARLGMTVNIPYIGCGLANGKWEAVEPIIESALGDVPVIVWDYEPAISSTQSTPSRFSRVASQTHRQK